MENSSQYFCHTCKQDFSILITESNQNDDVQCIHCQDYFVEQIESQEQLKGLKELYKNEIAQSQQKHQNNQNSNNLNKKDSKNEQDSDEEFHDCIDEESKIKDLQENEESKTEESKQSQGNAQHQQQQQPQIQNPLNIPPPIQQVYQSSDGRTTIRTQVQNIQLGQNPDLVNTIQQQINELVRSQGQQSVINQNGQNINVSTVSGSAGDTVIHIANIESTGNAGEEDVDGLDMDDGNQDWEDLNDPEAQIQQIDIDIDLDQFNDDPQAILNQINQQLNQHLQPPQGNQPQAQNVNFQQQQQQNQQQNQQQQQQQQQFPQFPNNNPFGNLFGGFQQQAFPGGPQQAVFQQVFNIGPGVNNLNGNLLNLNNLFGGFGAGAGNLEQNILNQVIQESLNSALNQNQGIPTSKSFIQKLKPMSGTDLLQKKDCQVCFEQFKDEDKFYKLPCKHLFHVDCILPWLEKHNTCPSCRHELPTDDLDYENRRRSPQDPLLDFVTGNGTQQNGNNNGSDGNGNSFNSTYHA